MANQLHCQSKTVAVNNPGGQPRQYCVQFRDGIQAVWKRSAVFRNPESARRRASELQNRGLMVRLVHYHLPTAA